MPGPTYDRFPTMEEIMTPGFNPHNYKMPQMQQPALEPSQMIQEPEGFQEISEDFGEVAPVKPVVPQQARPIHSRQNPVNAGARQAQAPVIVPPEMQDELTRRIQNGRREFENRTKDVMVSNVSQEELAKLMQMRDAMHRQPGGNHPDLVNPPDMETIVDSIDMRNRAASYNEEQNVNQEHQQKYQQQRVQTPPAQQRSATPPPAQPKKPTNTVNSDQPKQSVPQYIKQNNLENLANASITFSEEPGNVVNEPEENSDEKYPEYSLSATRPKHLSDRYERIGVVSNGIFYDDIYARPLNPKNLINLNMAITNKSYTALIDVLDNCVAPGDIRDMTLPDFTWLIYWIRMRSYPKTPIEYSWNSRYGNKNKVSLDKENLKFEHPTITKEEYKEYLARGLVVPRIRDHELLITGELDKVKLQTYIRAQYLAGASPTEKAYKFNNHDDLSILEDIKEFAEKISHRVVEIINVRDSLFSPQPALAHLEDRVAKIEYQLNNLSDKDRWREADLQVLVEDLREEVGDIKYRLDNGLPIEPKLEEVVISADVRQFFS